MHAETYSIPTIAVGQTRSGSLSSSDPVDPYYSATYYIDDYLLTGTTAGQSTTVTLTSSAFDTYLYLIDKDTQWVIAENDDYNGTNSQITFTPESGKTYLIRASSIFEAETGNYSLSVKTP